LLEPPHHWDRGEGAPQREEGPGSTPGKHPCQGGSGDAASGRRGYVHHQVPATCGAMPDHDHHDDDGPADHHDRPRHRPHPHPPDQHHDCSDHDHEQHDPHHLHDRSDHHPAQHDPHHLHHRDPLHHHRPHPHH